MLKRVIIFLILNFTGLILGGLFTGNGVAAEWYQGLNKAPWTPPGWFFGFAWTTIMICFSIYMALLWLKITNKTKLITAFSVQWILNFGWNPVFFFHKDVLAGLFIISSLTIIIGIIFFTNLNHLKYKSGLILPYLIWLIVATSLNAYILIQN